MLTRYYEYLNELRKTTKVNMFGAIPYLMDEFDLTRGEATNILRQWMKTYQTEQDE